MDPARVSVCSSASDDNGHSWQVRVSVVASGRHYPLVDGLSREQALQGVREVSDRLEAAWSTWVDPDFTRPAWRSVTAAADGWV